MNVDLRRTTVVDDVLTTCVKVILRINASYIIQFVFISLAQASVLFDTRSSMALSELLAAVLMCPARLVF